MYTKVKKVLTSVLKYRFLFLSLIIPSLSLMRNNSGQYLS
jgi:hypothetical protein